MCHPVSINLDLHALNGADISNTALIANETPVTEMTQAAHEITTGCKGTCSTEKKQSCAALIAFVNAQK